MAETQDETPPRPINLSEPLLPSPGTPHLGQHVARWVVNPLVTIRPVYENVYLANLEGAALVAERWNDGAVRVDIINLCPDAEGILPQQSRYHYLPLNDVQMVRDNPTMVCRWLAKVADRIESTRLRHGCEAVVVCCKAGIERSNLALLGWLIGLHHGTLPTTESFRNKAVRAYTLLHALKEESARYYGIRARFAKPGADDSGAYSWPALSSRSREWGSDMVARACLGVETFKEAAGIKEMSASAARASPARGKRKAEALV